MSTTYSFITLYIANTVQEGALTLYIEGGWATSNKVMALTVSQTHAVHDAALSLYLQTTEGGLTNSFLNLFIKGDFTTKTSSMPLYISGLGIESALSLYIKGAGLYPNYGYSESSLPLVLQRSGNLAGILPLRLKAVDDSTNSWLPLYIRNWPYATLTLVMPNVDYVWSHSNSFLNLFLGAGIISGSLPLTICSNYTQHGHLPLTLHHHGGKPNSYLNLFLRCTGFPANKSLTLYLLSTLTTKKLPLYIHGY